MVNPDLKDRWLKKISPKIQTFGRSGFFGALLLILICGVGLEKILSDTHEIHLDEFGNCVGKLEILEDKGKERPCPWNPDGNFEKVRVSSKLE